MSRRWRAATEPRVGCATVPRRLSTNVHPRLNARPASTWGLRGRKGLVDSGPRGRGARPLHKAATGCPVALAVREARDQRALSGSSEDRPQRLGRRPGASHRRPPCWLEPRFRGQASLPQVIHLGLARGLPLRTPKRGGGHDDCGGFASAFASAVGMRSSWRYAFRPRWRVTSPAEQHPGSRAMSRRRWRRFSRSQREDRLPSRAGWRAPIASPGR